MSRIASRIASIGRLKTSQELHAIIGQPISPCRGCGSGLLSVLHDGEVICEDCEQCEEKTKRVAFRVYCWTNSDGSVVAVDWEQVQMGEWRK
jgi:hypothetical protein